VLARLNCRRVHFASERMSKAAIRACQGSASVLVTPGLASSPRVLLTANLPENTLSSACARNIAAREVSSALRSSENRVGHVLNEHRSLQYWERSAKAS